MVVVRVPATVANLGPAFDAMGMAVTLYSEVVLAIGAESAVTISGEGKGQLPDDASNLVYRAAAAAAQRAGQPAAFSIRCTNTIPIGRGLGSSAAAIVAGAVAANAALGNPLEPDEMLDLAWRMEGHPDNVAAALFGGVVLTDVASGRVAWTRILPAWNAAVVVAVPDFAVPTGQARAVLPERVPYGDAVANISRTAWLITALLTGRAELLATAMEDRLHQPYRRALVPGMGQVFDAARTAGAWGAALCGSGPSVVGIAPPDQADAVGSQMVAAFSSAGHHARYLRLQVDTEGAKVLNSDESPVTSHESPVTK